MKEGTITLDGVTLRLATGSDGKRPGWEPHSAAILPGQQQTDEEKVSRAEPEHHRTWPWLDWHLGMGAAKQLPGDRRIHYSQGIGSDGVPGRLVQAHEVRTVTPANGGGIVSHWFEAGSKLYAVIGPTVRQITPTLNAETCAARKTDGAGNGDATGVYVSTANFTKASPLWYDGTSTKVYLGTDDNADPAVSFNGTATWAQDNATAWGYAALSQGTDGQRLWVTSCATDTTGIWVSNLGQGNDPFAAIAGAGSWSSLFRLADRTAYPTGIAALRDGIIVTLSNGQIYLFDYATGLPTPLEDADGLIRPPFALAGPVIWNGQLVISTARGLKLYAEEGDSPGVFYAIGPTALTGNDIPVLDLPTAICKADPEWLYVAFYDGTNSNVWVGRRPRPGEEARTRFLWESIAYLASRKVTSLHITHLESTVNQPILCIGTSTPDLSFITLPRPGKTRLNDTNCRSLTTAHSVYFPDADGGAPTITHSAARVRLKTRGLTSSETITPHVRVDGGGYQAQDDAVTSPFAPISLPDGLEGGSLGIQLEFTGSDNTVFKVVEGVELDVIEVPEASDHVLVTVYAAENATTTGGQMLNGPSDTEEFLKLLAGQSARVTAEDPFKRSFRAKVDGIYGVHLVPMTQEPGRFPDVAIRFRLNLYDSLDSQPGFVWDADYIWDSTSDPRVWDGSA
jgi:hypothetical protein